LSNQFDDDVKEEEIFQSQPQKKNDLMPRPGDPKTNAPIQNKNQIFLPSKVQIKMHKKKLINHNHLYMLL
jgi:hypothetical protein